MKMLDFALTKNASIRIGLHTKGNCWRFRYAYQTYFSGKLHDYSFWRFYLVIDRRHVKDDCDIGREIIDAIVSGGLMHAECVDHPDAPIVVVWKQNAAEQIGAMSLASKRS